MTYAPKAKGLTPDDGTSAIKDTLAELETAGLDHDTLDSILFYLYLDRLQTRYGSLYAVRHANLMLGNFCGDPTNFKEMYQ